MSDQKFCTFLYRTGADESADAEYCRYLPSKTGIVEAHRLTAGRLYVSRPDANPLHRTFAGSLDGFDYLLQGDFYEETTAPTAADMLVDGRLDRERVAAWVERLNGAFSGFVVDSATNEVWGFNDRFGFGHLYVTVRDGGLLLASNLWPALCHGRPERPERPERPWDTPALQEIFMFGYSLRDRTPLLDTRIVQPGLVMTCRDGEFGTFPYHTYEREDVAERRDHIAEFSAAAREHFESIGELTGWTRFGSTLSGGHDSRVIVNAMLANGRRPRCYVGYDRKPTWDSKRGARAARYCGLPSEVFDYQEMAAQDKIDANVLADGSGTASWAMNLGRLSARHDDCLYFGTSGDPVSGGWKVMPHLYDDLDSLAKAMMKSYYHEYTTPRSEFLEAFTDLDPATLDRKFRESFDGGPDIVAAFLINFFREGNFRRVRMFMQGAYLYSSPVHFFHDRRIYNYYSRLPYATLVGQKVHNRLCYYANAKLGLIPATHFPIPVALEQWLLQPAKRIVPKKFRSRMRSLARPSVAVKNRLDEDLMGFLEQHRREAGLEMSRFRSIMESDSRSGALTLRSGYVRNMLEPENLLAKSDLIGPKIVKQV